MEPKNECLENDFPSLNWVIFGFHENFQGSKKELFKFFLSLVQCYIEA